MTVTFRVTAVTPKSKAYNYDAYLEALNDDARARAREDGLADDEAHAYSDKDTLLYDVSAAASCTAMVTV